MTDDVKESAEYENFTGKVNQDDLDGSLAGFLGMEDDPTKEWQKHWKGMPAYEQEDNPTFKTIYLHFRNEDDFNEFVKKYRGQIDSEQTITVKTKSMWYPKLDREANALRRWIEE